MRNIEKKCHQEQHPCHQSQITRLNKIVGQLEGIKKMIDKQQYCVDIVTQLKAVQAATRAVEINILESHLDACVTNVFNSEDKQQVNTKIAELMQLFKKF